MEFNGHLIYQGAESRVYESVYIDRPVIIKERLSKSYRVKELDKKINKHRLQQEIKCMVKCRRAGVATPRYITKVTLCMYIHHVIIQSMIHCMEAST
jgi:TP53 regulating kinase-like protein